MINLLRYCLQLPAESTSRIMFNKANRCFSFRKRHVDALKRLRNEGRETLGKAESAWNYYGNELLLKIEELERDLLCAS